MKHTTMDLQWEPCRLLGLEFCAAAPRPSVRDHLWVSLMSTRRSLDSALEDRLLGFPRRPAALSVPWAGSGWRVSADTPVEKGHGADVEDLAYVALGLSALTALGWCFWQMCLSVV